MLPKASPSDRGACLTTVRVAGTPHSTPMENYSKRLLEKASPTVREACGCSRNRPRPCRKLAGAPDSTAMEFYSKRMYPQAPQAGWETCGCSRKLRKMLGRLSGSPLFHPCGILFQAAVMAKFPRCWGVCGWVRRAYRKTHGKSSLP